MLLRSPTFNRCVGCAARSGAGGGQTTTRTMAMHGADHGFTPVLGVGEQVLIGVVGAGNDATSSLASGPPSPGWPFLTPILRAAGSDKKPGQPCDAAGAGRNLVTAPDPIGGPLVLRHASKRSSGTWGPDDYDVIGQPRARHRSNIQTARWRTARSSLGVGDHGRGGHAASDIARLLCHPRTGQGE